MSEWKPEENQGKEMLEKDYLVYTGSKIPRVIRFAWTIFILFTLAYLARYAWPDLLDWMRK